MNDTTRATVNTLVGGLDLDPDLPFAGPGLPLCTPAYGKPELIEAIGSLLDGELTMGRRVRAFEAAWATLVGVEHAVMVNSGSSALLVMLGALLETGHLRPGQEVVVPAVTWSTSLFSLLQAGLRARVVDVDADSLCVEGDFEDPVLAVHLLGAPSRARSPLLLEDACGAHGARIGDQQVGSIGLVGAFSFFFSHHLTTGEGGMVTTNERSVADAARSLRAHGWVRERSDRAELELANADTDPRFLFVSAGYNLRPTEVAGGFGIHQTPRLEGFVERRNRNHKAWCRRIDGLGLPLRSFPERPGTTHAAFAFPLLLDKGGPLSRAELCRRLGAFGIETRPISGSNLTRQPAFPRLHGARIDGPLSVADAIHERGLFVGQSHAFGEAQGELLAEALSDAYRKT